MNTGIGLVLEWSKIVWSLNGQLFKPWLEYRTKRKVAFEWSHQAIYHPAAYHLVFYYYNCCSIKCTKHLYYLVYCLEIRHCSRYKHFIILFSLILHYNKETWKYYYTLDSFLSVPLCVEVRGILTPLQLPVRIVWGSVEVVGGLPPHAQLRHIGQAEWNCSCFFQQCHNFGVVAGSDVSTWRHTVTVTHALDANAVLRAERNTKKWDIVGKLFAGSWKWMLWLNLGLYKAFGTLVQWGSEIRKHLKSPDFLKVRFQTVRFSNDWALAKAIAIVPTIQNPDIFVWISNGFWQNGGHFSGFQIVGLSHKFKLQV